MTINTLPPAPSRADAANADTFSEIAETFVAALPVFSTQVNSTLTDVNAAASGALASSNFKGSWAALTGAMSIPASVLHTGTLWLLVTNTSDITADEPGVSAKWLNLAAVSGYVSLTGNQTVAGDKTFTDDVVVGTLSTAGAVTAASFTGNGSGLTNVSAVNGLGTGQTWQTMTRAFGTVYQNTTGRPICLSYDIVGDSGFRFLATIETAPTSIDLVQRAQYRNGSTPDAGYAHGCTLTLVIPAGWYYKCLGSGTLSASELR